jgi:hypothetical protein
VTFCQLNGRLVVAILVDTLKTNMPATEEHPQVFVLDLPRAADDVKEQLRRLGDNPTKEAIGELVDRLRLPNGYSFEANAYNDGGARTVQVDEHFHGPNALRVFVKEISDAVRRYSALGHRWSSKAAEIVYSAYNPWANTYA